MLSAKNSRACANERIPRRHALATSHWQRYITDQNTVAKYRPCSSTFCGNCSFCTLPNVFACQNSLKHFASHFYTLAGNTYPLQRPLAREELLDCAQGSLTEKELVSATERLSEPQGGEFSRMADNKRSNRIENAGGQKIFFLKVLAF